MATQRLTVPETVALEREPDDPRWGLPAVAFMRDGSEVHLGGRSLRQAHDEMTRDRDADVWFGLVHANDVADFGVVLPDSEHTGPNQPDAEPRIAPLTEGEERLLQTVHRADGNRNDIYLLHRRPSDDAATGAGEPINFVAVIRFTDQDPDDTSPPWAWQRGPTERSIYIALAEAFVNAPPPPPGTSISLDPDVRWFVDRIPENAGPEVAAMETMASRAHRYVAACGDVLTAANACLEVANRAVGARSMIAQHRHDGMPGTPIAIRNFTTWAEEAEREFASLFRAFAEACATARDAAAELLAADPVRAEVALAMSVGGDALDSVATVKGILGARFGPSPGAFLAGVEQANALMQNPPDERNIYTPPAVAQSDERTCPWCAETIKSAAVICGFCGRDPQVQPNGG